MRAPLLAVLVLAACASAQGAPERMEQTLKVVNHNTRQANVYWVNTAGGTPLRIGEVHALSARALRMPAHVRDGYIRVRLLGTHQLWNSDPLYIDNGQKTELHIQSALGMSNTFTLRY